MEWNIAWPVLFYAIPGIVRTTSRYKVFMYPGSTHRLIHIKGYCILGTLPIFHPPPPTTTTSTTDFLCKLVHRMPTHTILFGSQDEREDCFCNGATLWAAPVPNKNIGWARISSFSGSPAWVTERRNKSRLKFWVHPVFFGSGSLSSTFREVTLMEQS